MQAVESGLLDRFANHLDRRFELPPRLVIVSGVCTRLTMRDLYSGGYDGWFLGFGSPSFLTR
jgi:hypothetical protein